MAGDSITLPNFGTFKIVERSARKGRNPATGEEIDIAASKAEEEVYPGFNKCNASTETMGQENVCWGKAIKYWAEKLDAQYARIRKGCASAPNPEQCKARLKKMQAGWLNYSNGLADFLKNGLLHEQEFATTSSINESLTFEAWATRRQYEMLKMLE